jgi:hypothetical protein
MLEITDERGETPLFDDEPPRFLTEAARTAEPQEDRSDPVALGIRKLNAAKEVLDGVGGLGWGVVGFIVGGLFWHFIGFWVFVSEIVLAGSPHPVVKHATPHVSVPFEARSHWVQMADAAGPQCTSLKLDRQTGVTSAQPCEGDDAPLPSDSFQGREDRVIPADGFDVH